MAFRYVNCVDYHWRIQGGARTAPGVQILSFSCSFRQKNWLPRPLWELAPPQENHESTTMCISVFRFVSFKNHCDHFSGKDPGESWGPRSGPCPTLGFEAPKLSIFWSYLIFPYFFCLTSLGILFL